MEKPSLDKAKTGAIRFNTDTSQMEVYDGNQWTGILATSPAQETGGTRAVIAGGKLTHPNKQNIIQFVNMDSTGNAEDFGDLVNGASAGFFTASSRTRGIFAGSYSSPAQEGTNTIEFVTIASQGNSVDFGADMTTKHRSGHSASSSTRGVFGGGFDGGDRSNMIEYITIASTGNSKDFGDLIQKGMNGSGYTVSSPTRGVFAGGDTPGAKVNLIQFITIATTGNSIDFGDLNELRGSVAAASNATIALVGGGASPTYFKSIDKITIPTLGDAVEYGDLADVVASHGAGASPTRIIFCGGYNPAASPSVRLDVIQYKQFASGGDTNDFGNLLNECALPHPVTNGHGGL